MKSIEFKYECLDGYYKLFVEYDENVLNYKTETNLDDFEYLEGRIDKPLDFIKNIEKVHMEKWERYYLPENEGIEDATKWEVRYFDANKKYVFNGEETYYPYTYNEFLNALKILDKNLNYFD